MKRSILILTIILGFAVQSQAQVNPHAIGVRANSGTFGSGAELTYQHGFGDANRLELDLGVSANLLGFYQDVYVRLTGSYHWVFNIVSGFNWFIGPAVQVGTYHTNDPAFNPIYPVLGAGAQGGVEFDFNVFDVPLMVSADARPIFGLAGPNFRAYYGTAASVRYTF